MILSARGCDTDTRAVSLCGPQNPPRNWRSARVVTGGAGPSVLWLCCCADVIWLLPPSACSTHIPGEVCTAPSAAAAEPASTPQTSECFSGAAASLQQELVGLCLGWARGCHGAGSQPSPSDGFVKDRGSRASARCVRRDSSLTGGNRESTAACAGGSCLWWLLISVH